MSMEFVNFIFAIIAYSSTFLTVYINAIALRKAKIVYNFGLSECNRVLL